MSNSSSATVSAYSSGYDMFRQILTGEIYEEADFEQDREMDMERFLQSLCNMNKYIDSVHLLAELEDGERLNFHYGRSGDYMRDEVLFEELVGYEGMERQKKTLILIPPHGNTYWSGVDRTIFTVARNYFDLRGPVENINYVGTIFFDIDQRRFERVFRGTKIQEHVTIYVTDASGMCFYSNQETLAGAVITEELAQKEKEKGMQLITSEENDYGLTVKVAVDTEVAFSAIYQMQKMIYLMAVCLLAGLLVSSVLFSGFTTRSVRGMLGKMREVEKGNFDIELPVRGTDEFSVLSKAFNQMSAALKAYIEQSYLAQIRQTEAELTALKSQIYPHFLYNTLEIIRMTALEDGGDKVPVMLESLAEQIHYLIGPMQDMVPLEKEISIIEKYVFLLNCRIGGKVQLVVNIKRSERLQIPKLVLQPIVENAYVHGIRPKSGSGSIMIEAVQKEENLEIAVMDNGIGMSKEEVEKTAALLNGDDPGIKNEYNWQSIGLKNVHDRLRYLYGPDYGIFITSTPGVGTMVRILMPRGREDME